MNNSDPSESFDARNWVTAWMQTIKLHPNIPWDEGTMLAWFANALMRGYDEGRKRAFEEKLREEKK